MHTKGEKYWKFSHEWCSWKNIKENLLFVGTLRKNLISVLLLVRFHWNWKNWKYISNDIQCVIYNVIFPRDKNIYIYKIINQTHNFSGYQKKRRKVKKNKANKEKEEKRIYIEFVIWIRVSTYLITSCIE